MNELSTPHYIGALRDLIADFDDDDRMTSRQEAHAEQARENLHGAAERLIELNAEVACLLEVIRLCRPYIMTDEHSEEADCDCDYMMDEVLQRHGIKRSAG